ncbi:uncharacterized protein [Littorina saxatilis]|uniref:uncharacterized protein n=1 Tax=Littorina saxatilis TaxID=31220 RepID=UPI0038B5B53E
MNIALSLTASRLDSQSIMSLTVTAARKVAIPYDSHRLTVLLLALCSLLTCSTCNPCSSSSFLFSLMPVPATCRNYALCFRGRALRELPCPKGTAFDPARLFCTSELHQSCLVQESQDKVQTQLTCPRGTTTNYFPDYSQGCPSHRYFLCKNGVISGQICAEGHVFDEGTDSCVTSLSLVCGVTGPSCSEKSRDSASYADYSLGCPALKFAMCFRGNVSVVLRCPEGLFYNGAVKNCDYPDNIVCGYYKMFDGLLTDQLFCRSEGEHIVFCFIFIDQGRRPRSINMKQKSICPPRTDKKAGLATNHQTSFLSSFWWFNIK